MENIKFSVRTNLEKSLKNNEIFQKSLKIDKFRFSSWIVLEFLDRSLILMMAKLRVGTFDSWGRGRGWFGVGIIFLTWIFFFLGHGVCMKFFTHVTPFLSVHWTRVNFCWQGSCAFFFCYYFCISHSYVGQGVSPVCKTTACQGSHCMVNSLLASATERHRKSATKTTSSNPVLERYKDSLKKTLGILGACCHSDHSRWSTLATHQDTCGHTIQQAVYSFEDTRKANMTEKRRRGKDRDAAAPNLDATFICSRCSRACQSRIELTSHVRACSRGGKEKERRGEGTRRG